MKAVYGALEQDVISKDQQYWSSNLYVGEIVRAGFNGAFGVNHVTGHIKAWMLCLR